MGKTKPAHDSNKRVRKSQKLEPKKKVNNEVEELQQQQSDRPPLEFPRKSHEQRHQLNGHAGSKSSSLTKKTKQSDMKPYEAPPLLLNMVYNFLKNLKYTEAARGMRTEDREASDHNMTSWKSASEGMPDLSEIFSQWSHQNPGRIPNLIGNEDTQKRAKGMVSSTGEAKPQIKSDEKHRSEKGRKVEAKEDDSSSDEVQKVVIDTDESSGKGEERNTRPGSLTLAAGSSSVLKRKASQMSDNSSDDSTSDDDSSDSSSDSESSSSESDSKGDSDKETTSNPRNLNAGAKAVSNADGMSKVKITTKNKIGSSSSSSSSDDSTRIPKNESIQSRTAKRPIAKVQKSSSASSSSSSSSDSNTNGVKTSTGVKTKDEKDVSASDTSESSDSSHEAEAGEEALGVSRTQAMEKSEPMSDSSATLGPLDVDDDAKLQQVIGESSARNLHAKHISNDPKESSSEVLVFNKPVSKSAEARGEMSHEQQILPATASNFRMLENKKIKYSRIPADVKVDPRFRSNQYIPYDYANKAYKDLSVTKGKGFTKEKNKKKRGSYRGGGIDVSGGRAIKFDD